MLIYDKMTIKEGYAEMKRDIPSVRAKGRHLAYTNGRLMKINETRIFTYTSTNRNKWYLLVQKHPDGMGYLELMEYTTGGKGLKGILMLREHDDGEQDFMHEYSPHVFQRYAERSMNMSEYNWVRDFKRVLKTFINRNLHICATGNMFHSNVTHAFVRDGMLFGNNAVAEGFTHLQYKTFVTTELMSEGQRKEYLRLWGDKTTGNDILETF